MKKIFYNLKLANSKLIWCMAALFMMLSFAMKVDCSDGFKKSVITLPKAENGIEKIEYMVNGEAKGSTDGINSIELEPGAKITFAVKFESEGYNKLHVRNVKITSENGSTLRLNTYSKDDEGNFVLMRVMDSELINPEQTYVSSDYIVSKDDKLSFEGIEEDKYSVEIADENNDVNLSEAVSLKYSENGGNYVDANFSENENAFIIKDLTRSSNVKLAFEIKEGYTNSDLSLIIGEKRIAIDSKSKICTLPELKNDSYLEIRNLEKNSYNITFNEYTNAKFFYRIAGSEDEFKSLESVKVNYGDNLEIKCETSGDDILQAGEVTANGKVLAANDGIYTLENIKDNHSIAITPNANAIYTISVSENEDRMKLCDTFGNETTEIDAKQNDSVNFKIIPNSAYTKNFILAEIYAVPVSKLTNGSYDINANPEEAKSFLMMPSGNYTYAVKNINEPVKIIANKMEKNVYTVTLPENIIGATAEVEINEDVTKLTENKFKVAHGSDFVINLEAQAGYDISDMNVGDVNSSLEIKKDGNKYTFKNIDSDKYLIINGAETSSCNVSFDAKDVVATTESGSAWKNNTASIKYQEGTLKFKVRPADGSGNSNENIALNIKSGKGKLEKIDSEQSTYSLSSVTSNIVLSANRANSSNVTITLKSDNDDIEFTDANDESIILPEENTVKYGTDLNFKVISKSGKSTDNTSIMSTVSNPIIESGTLSNTYSVTALRSGMALASTRETEAKKDGQFVSLCEKFHANGRTYDNIYDSIIYEGTEEPKLIVLSKDPEALECINENNTVTTSSAGEIIDSNFSNVGLNDYKPSDMSMSLESYQNAPDSGFKVSIPIPKLNYFYESTPENIYSFGNEQFEILFNKNADSYQTFCEIYSEKISGQDIDPKHVYIKASSENNNAGYFDQRNEGSSQKILLKEAENESYYAVKEEPHRTLQYLKDCYCQCLSNIYPDVTLSKAGLTRDDKHNCETTIEAVENLENNKIKTDYTEVAGGNIEVNLTPVTSKFKIYLDSNKAFKAGVTEPLSLNEGAHAKLSQEIKQDENGYYVNCELTATPFDETITLNWSSDSEIVTTTFNIDFTPIGGIFRNSQGTETNSDSVSYGSNLIFYTEPQTGYQYTDTLTVTRNQTSYAVDDISKIAIDSEEANYNGEWIALDITGSPIFIKAKKDGSKIKYEIAGSGENITKYITRSGNQQEGSDIIKYTKTTEQSITAQGVTSDLIIKSKRDLRKLSVTFSYAEGSKYTEIDGTTEIGSIPKELNYGEALAFKVVAENGYDISNIQVMASTPGSTNILPLTNGMYVIVNITENTTVTVTGIEKSNISLTFEQYDSVKYKNTSGAEYAVRQQIPYNEEVIFQIDINEEYSKSADAIAVKVNNVDFGSSSSSGQPYKQDNLYIIPGSYVNEDLKITIEGLAVNTYNVSLTPSTGISYRDVTNPQTVLPKDNSGINYGNSFRFRLQADSGYNTDNIEVVAKSNSGTGSPVTLIPANGIYTIDNITSDYIVTVSGVSKEQHTVEFRTVTGVACVDSYGKTLPSSVTVSDGDDYSFYLSFDPAYSKSKDTADVTVKGTNNKVPHDSSGKYTISNIKENKIVEVINVKKNSYTATFVPAEGVVYRTAKGKEFTGTQNVDYGESLYFKISLLDAYDQSVPGVKMNGTKNLIENSGSYVIENINDDVVITVENVEKNPEEVTIDYIQGVPDPVTNENDVNAVVAATKAYNSLSDDEKKLVTNKQALEKAQNEAGNINHASNGLYISGIDWNVKLIVTPLSDNEEEMKAFAEKVDRRTLLSLYKAELIDLLTGESYSVPYGKEVQITMPCPDLTGYKNVTVAHENLADNMEYLDPSIVDGTAKVSTTSVGLFGIAAKEIPNYSESVSDMSISMGNLVSGDDELKTLLGEDLSSELGHLIDLEDENNNDGSSGAKNKGTDGSGGTEGSDSLLNSMTNGIASLAGSIYNWALDNELLSVLAVLLLGALLIFIILLMNRKKDKDEEEDHLKKDN